MNRYFSKLSGYAPLLLLLSLTAIICHASEDRTGPTDADNLPAHRAVSFAASLIADSGTVHTGGSWTEEKLKAIGVESMLFLNTLGEYNGVDAPGIHTGTILSDPFVLQDELVIYAGGNLRDDKIALTLDDTQTGDSLRLMSLRKINGIAVKRWSIPTEWKGRSVILCANDQNPTQSGWIGISPPLTQVPGIHRFQSFHRLFENGRHAFVPCLILAIIGISGTLVITRHAPRMREHSLILIFAIPSTVAFAAFFIYLASAVAGFFFSVIVAASGCFILIRFWKDLDGIPDGIIRQYLPALCLALLSAVLYSSLLQLNWSSHNSVVTAQERFLGHVLPLDNFLPYTTMERLFTEEGLKPFVMEWRSTDRPPLQAALVLLVRPFMTNSVEGYQGISVFINCWAFIGVYYLLSSMGIRRAPSLWILSLLVFSGTFFLNGTYVWPRILPLVFLCIVIGMLVRNEDQRRDFLYWLIIGIGCALSILIHQGSAIALAGVFGAYLIRHPRILRTQVLAACIVLAVWILPWVIFQKTYDPPGNMLQKRFLANHPEFDDVSFKDALIQTYSNLTMKEWLDGRLANIKVIVGDFRTDFCHFFIQIGRGSHAIRLGTFLSLGITVLPVAFALFGLVLRPKILMSSACQSWRIVASMLAVGVALWTLLLLPSGRTIIPHGSYLSPALLLILAGALASLNRTVLVITSGFNFLCFALIWALPRFLSIQTRTGLEDTEIIDWGSLTIVCGTVLCILWLLGSNPPGEETEADWTTTPDPCL